MSETFIRGLRCLERIDGIALLRLRAPSADLAAVFPDRIILTQDPDGCVAVALPEASLDAGLADLGTCRPAAVICGLCAIRASGVCMSGEGGKARLLAAALAHRGIDLYALSLCDLAALFVVASADADDALDCLEETVPLTL